MRLAGALVVVFALSAGHAASAQPAATDGERHLAAAQQLYATGRYDDAIAELQAAQAVDPHPDQIWAIAQAYRLKGDCPHAIAQYGAYLRTGPTPAATKITQKMIDECVATMPPPGEPAAAPAQAPAPPPAPTEPLIVREVQRIHTRDVTVPWYRDKWGDGLVGGGFFCIAVGGIATAIANSHDTKAGSVTSYDRLDSELVARDHAAFVATVGFSAGGALIVGGLLHYALRPRHVRTEVVVDPLAGSAGVGVTWSLP